MTNSIKLDKRLGKISEIITHTRLLADIGTDHAYLPVSLVAHGKADKAVASDIVDGPVAHARQTVAWNNLTDKIEVIKSPGLLGVAKYLPDTIVIAGMGGETIKTILCESNCQKSSSVRLILQPMTHEATLRKYLLGSGYALKNEYAVCDRKHAYLIIDCVYCGNILHKPDAFYELGLIPETVNDENTQYLHRKKLSAEKALAGLSFSKKDNSKKIGLYKEIIRMCDEYERRRNLQTD